MGKRKLAQLLDSEDEEEDEPAKIRAAEGATSGGTETPAAASSGTNAGGGSAVADDEESEEEPVIEPKPLGEVIKRSGRGKGEKRHYQAFELDGNRYELEDPVLVTPEERNQKPYVAIIKEIKQSKDGSVAITGQWFYRPEEAEKKGGGSWVASDSRELFYSFHRDEVAAESVMHKCVVHFIPSNKQAPLRSKHPGFIVRKVYDTVEKKLWRLTDKDYEDSKQYELDLLVQKTRSALGELPDIEPEDAAGDQEEADKVRRQNRRRTLLQLNVNKDEHAGEGFGRPDTPGTTLPLDSQSESYRALHERSCLTGNKARDMWLDKLVTSLKYVCTNSEAASKSNEESVAGGQKAGEIGAAQPSAVENRGQKEQMDDGNLSWPEGAISVVTALESMAFETLGGSDIHKYNLKMRSLEFNMKSNKILAVRFLKRELDASKVLNMTPAELREGLTAEEKSGQEPEEPETLQMADVRCSICSEKMVGVKDIIHIGTGDRYQLECLKCGNSWYSSRDSIASLSIQAINAKNPVGTAPWATSKFDEVERELISPRNTEKEKPATQDGSGANAEENKSSQGMTPESRSESKTSLQSQVEDPANK